MEIITDEDAADAALRLACPPDVEPLLTDPEFQGLLDGNHPATQWVAVTPYRFGAIILPTDDKRIGARFRCTRPGTSGTTEPTWSDLRDATYSDGSVTWQESGPEVSLWDIDQAAYAGWQLKLAKATPFVGSDDGLDEVAEHCRREVERLKPVRMA